MSKIGGSDPKDTLYCSFCGKASTRCARSSPGHGLHCDECIDLCTDIIGEENKARGDEIRGGIPTPKRSARFLTITSSARMAKKVLSVAVYNHYKRFKHQADHKMLK